MIINKESKIDIIIPLSSEHIAQFRVNLPMIKKNLPYKKIYVVCKKSTFVNLACDGVKFIDEDELVEGLSYANVSSLLIDLCGDDIRTGWYLQQFIKMQYAQVCDNDYYIVWDADTIPLSKIKFIDEDGRMLFNIKGEHHIPYFITMERLFNRSLKRPNGSFISEGMIINTYIMRHMIDEIMAIYLSGKERKKCYLFEIILKSINKDELLYSGFSEFETYGNYIYTYYPYLYKERILRTCRKGYQIYNHILNEKELELLPYDTITFENRHRKLTDG